MLDSSINPWCCCYEKESWRDYLDLALLKSGVAEDAMSLNGKKRALGGAAVPSTSDLHDGGNQQQDRTRAAPEQSAAAPASAAATASSLPYNCPRVVLRLLQLIRRYGDDEPQNVNQSSKKNQKVVSSTRIVNHLLETVKQHLENLDDEDSLMLLWDILGRLLGVLLQQEKSDVDGSSCGSSWKARTAAGQAIEAIAKLLPEREKVRLLQEGTALELDWSKLRQVLATAKPLFARNDDDDDDDDNNNTREDSSCVGDDDDVVDDPSSTEFLQKRIASQRRIIHRRLGLSVLSAVVDKDTEDDFTRGMIGSEDLSIPMSATSAKTAKPSISYTYQQQQPASNKRQRLTASATSAFDATTTELDDEDAHPLSLRSLLLAQLRNSSKSSRPQQVVVHELLLYMLDPSWQARHGALIGTLALLRACYQDVDAVGEASNYTVCWSSWPCSVLSLSLFILATDRFGDFSSSGLASDGSGDGDDWTLSSLSYRSSGSLVAPVRELAGQVVALVWIRASPGMQRNTLAWLLDHGKMPVQQQENWEVKHGSLTACKFIMALLMHKPPSWSDTPRHTNLEPAVQQMVHGALDALLDKSDDVKSVAAQLLLQVYNPQSKHHMARANLDASILLVYDAVAQAKSHSSCLIDLVTLLAAMVQLGNCQKDHLMPLHVLDTLIRLLDSDFASVKHSALVCINTLVRPIAKKVAETRDQQFLSTFVGLIKKLFSTFFLWKNDDEGGVNNIVSQTKLEYGVVGADNQLCVTRDKVWHEVTQASHIVFVKREDKGDDWKRLLECLLFSYFGVTNRDQPLIQPTKANFSIQCAAAKALAAILYQTNASNQPLVEFSVHVFLLSPWAFQCEAACLLLQEILSTFTLYSDVIYSSDNVSKLLHMMLGESPPPCLSLDPALYNSLELHAMISLCDQAFHFAASDIDSATTETLSQRAQSVVQIWCKAFDAVEDKDTVTASVLSMRVNATVAGAVLKIALPPKLTPMIRALITSVKNEELNARLNKTCAYLSELLYAIRNQPKFARARQKVLETICEIAMVEGSHGKSSSGSQRKPGTAVLGLILRNMTKTDTLKDLQPLWLRIKPLLGDPVEYDTDKERLRQSIYLFQIVGECLQADNQSDTTTIPDFIASLIKLACHTASTDVQVTCSSALGPLCSPSGGLLKNILIGIVPHLKDQKCDRVRCNACSLLETIVFDTGADVSPFVRSLLPLAMVLMTDPVDVCAQKANRIFAALVQAAPLAQQNESIPLDDSSCEADCVIDHLILGKPLPSISFPEAITDSLNKAGVVLRQYQMEGIAWLHFLQAVKLNGSLCDGLGLGKTIQALISVALSHHEISQVAAFSEVRSLIVCPSTLVGHWRAEIEKFFPGQDIFKVICFSGNKTQRKEAWDQLASANIVLTSYSVLRTEISLLSSQNWMYCVLDEGHLLKNPTTATAKASRKLRSRHKLILTGTPVQNSVNEIWATFDFLMPNFLGSSTSFAKEFVRPISKSQLPGATASALTEGIEKLKSLHQQVMPFILRREKEDVLKELPPKIVSVIKVPMSNLQAKICRAFCSSEGSQASLAQLENALQTSQSSSSEPSLGADVLKSLLFLRLLCTHPSLVAEADSKSCEEWNRVSSSGKLLALIDVLSSAGINNDSITAADNDASLLYCGNLDDDHDNGGSYDKVISSMEDSGLGPESEICAPARGRKCVIFAQFTKSLDIVEDLVFKPHMPSLQYLRLDGQVPSGLRADMAIRFNSDPAIKVLLATTRVGGLGLNLTGADTVIFLENDYNPFADIQAMDRAHRIGQEKTVNVYRLVTEDSIEEKILDLQEKKVAVSDAIVNTDNSSMCSMGTDRLLDIFAFRTSGSQESSGARDDTGIRSSFDLDALFERYSEDYESLSVDRFLKSLQSS